LIAVLPVAAWVCWSDLKYMKIPNTAVMAVAAIWLVVGFLVVPFEPWAWRWVNLLVVLAIGFVLNAVAHVGAGDAKFAAAAAPFFRVGDAAWVLPLFAAFLLGAFAAHRLLRAIPAVRRAAPDWISWKRADFPMGLALVGTFVAYLSIMAFELQDELLSIVNRT
jgi:prepilin peptidase CpaA